MKHNLILPYSRQLVDTANKFYYPEYSCPIFNPNYSLYKKYIHKHENYSFIYMKYML